MHAIDGNASLTFQRALIAIAEWVPILSLFLRIPIPLRDLTRLLSVLRA